MHIRQSFQPRLGFDMRPGVFGLVLLGLPPRIASDQPPIVDVLVGQVQVSPATAQAGQRVTVSATIRRRAPPNAPPLAEPVAVDVEFAVGQGPFATERVTLKPDEARRVEARWTAQPGQHVLVVRIRQVMTLQGQAPVNPRPRNNQGDAGSPISNRADLAVVRALEAAVEGSIEPVETRGAVTGRPGPRPPRDLRVDYLGVTARQGSPQEDVHLRAPSGDRG